jgi:hypothetical protein
LTFVSILTFFEYSCLYLEKRSDLVDYSNDKRSRRIDDDKDDDCYDEEENEFDYSNIEEEIVVGIDYKFCPDLMNWLLTQIGLDYTKLDWATLLVKAGKCGNLEFIMWVEARLQVLMHQRLSFDRFVDVVATNGQRQVLEWLQIWQTQNCVEMTATTYIAQNLPDLCIHASKCGHLNILQWSLSNGLHIDLHKCLRAAIQYNRLHILQWLNSELKLLSPEVWNFNGGDIDLSELSLGSSCDIFQWVHLNGCPWSARTFKALKTHCEFKDRRDWAFKNGCQRDRFNLPVTQVEDAPRRDITHDAEQEDEEEEDDIDDGDDVLYSC